MLYTKRAVLYMDNTAHEEAVRNFLQTNGYEVTTVAEQETMRQLFDRERQDLELIIFGKADSDLALKMRDRIFRRPILVAMTGQRDTDERLLDDGCVIAADPSKLNGFMLVLERRRR